MDWTTSEEISTCIWHVFVKFFPGEFRSAQYKSAPLENNYQHYKRQQKQKKGN